MYIHAHIQVDHQLVYSLGYELQFKLMSYLLILHIIYYSVTSNTFLYSTFVLKNLLLLLTDLQIYPRQTLSPSNKFITQPLISVCTHFITPWTLFNPQCVSKTAGTYKCASTDSHITAIKVIDKRLRPPGTGQICSWSVVIHSFQILLLFVNRINQSLLCVFILLVLYIKWISAYCNNNNTLCHIYMYVTLLLFSVSASLTVIY